MQSKPILYIHALPCLHRLNMQVNHMIDLFVFFQSLFRRAVQENNRSPLRRPTHTGTDEDTKHMTRTRASFPLYHKRIQIRSTAASVILLAKTDILNCKPQKGSGEDSELCQVSDHANALRGFEWKCLVLSG